MCFPFHHSWGPPSCLHWVGHGDEVEAPQSVEEASENRSFLSLNVFFLEAVMCYPFHHLWGQPSCLHGVGHGDEVEAPQSEKDASEHRSFLSLNVFFLKGRDVFSPSTTHGGSHLACTGSDMVINLKRLNPWKRPAKTVRFYL